LADGVLFSNKAIVKSNDNARHIVFVVTTITGFCGHLPQSLKQTLLQAKAANMKSMKANNTEVTLLSNFKQCRWALHDLKNGDEMELRTVNTVDSHAIKSNRTLEFERLIKKMPVKGDDGDTVTTSLYRYFMLEDYMTHHKVAHVLHFESDTMLYGDMFPLLSVLRSTEGKHSYGSVLAATPSIHKRFLSASTFWIGSVGALHDLNEFLLGISRNTSSKEFKDYASWLHEFACCKDKGIFPDESGRGLKSWAFSDMTLLAYYRHLYHGRIKLFPSLPFDKNHFRTELPQASGNAAHAGGAGGAGLDGNNSSGVVGAGAAHKHHHHGKHLHLNLSLYSQGGSDVGDDTGYGLFDTGKGGWGSHLHGSMTLSGMQSVAGKEEEAASVAIRHIVEQAVSRFNCTVEMKCSLPDESRPVVSSSVTNKPHFRLRRRLSNVTNTETRPAAIPSGAVEACYTRPFVTCGEGAKWMPLWSLHLIKTESSFNTFRSKSCSCQGAF